MSPKSWKEQFGRELSQEECLENLRSRKPDGGTKQETPELPSGTSVDDLLAETEEIYTPFGTRNS